MSRSNAAAALLFRRKGDGSTLNLDFTKMGDALDSRFTFTRSTTATYINSSGYVASAAINESRFDYDPTTLAPKGLLIEGSATNFLYSSQNLANASYWTLQTAYTSISTTETSPSNAANANLFTEPNVANPRSIYQSYALAAGTSTASIFIKYNSGTVRGLRFVIASASSNFGYVTINMSTGAVIQSAASVGTASNTSATVTAYPNAWYRITLTTTLAATSNFIFVIPVAISGIGTPSSDYGRESYTGNSSTFSLWGAQFESGTGASSYIPTVASQVTRATDVCTMSGTNFTSWFNNTEGTILFIGNNTIVPAPSNFSSNWALVNAGASSRISQYTRHTNGRIGATCRDSGGGALTFDSPGATTTILTTAEYKTAFALKSSDFAYSVNGAAIGTGDGVGVFETVASLDFTRDGVRNGHIKCFKFWPTRLTNAQLIAIST